MNHDGLNTIRNGWRGDEVFKKRHTAEQFVSSDFHRLASSVGVYREEMNVLLA